VRSGAVATAATADVSAADLAVLARLHADATAFYAAQLTAGTPDAARARQVLGQRAVPAGAVAAYEFGYAPPGWTALADHLRGRGYTDDQLVAAGVGTTTRRGSVVDRFRDRLMLPVRDPGGQRVVAFLGRALAQSPEVPKYLNSPQTVLYSKGDVLYGLGAEPTRQAFTAGARPVLVEGALDAIAVTFAGGGRYAGVAPSGTARTAGQVAALELAVGPLAKRGVTVAFDADPAGRDAALRSHGLLRAADAWPAAAVLPDGQDPASLAQHHGPDALRRAGRCRPARGPGRQRAAGPLDGPAALGRGADRRRPRRRRADRDLPVRTRRQAGAAGRPAARARTCGAHQRRRRHGQPGC